MKWHVLTLPFPGEGNYYIAVYGPGGGKYSLAPGFQEQFTPSEWLQIPWSVVSIHLWEGQSPWVIFAPMILVVIGGLALMGIYRKQPGLHQDPVQWMIRHIRTLVSWRCGHDHPADHPCSSGDRIYQ